MKISCIISGVDYKPGDPAPHGGYLAMHEWAEVQIKAGLKQEQCGRCSKWFFPQELSDIIDVSHAITTRGKPITISDRVCLGCAQTKNPKHSSDAPKTGKVADRADEKSIAYWTPGINDNASS